MAKTSSTEPQGIAAPQGRLAGKVALITGAAGNLGQAIARRYLGEGATVVFSGRDRSRTDTARDAAVAAVGRAIFGSGLCAV